MQNDLTSIGIRYGSDKFTRHSFQSIYEMFLEPRRDEPLKVLEIGIGGENTNAGGGSLFAWRDYLPNSLIYGIDIYDKSHLDEARIKTFVRDQADPVGLSKICDEHGPFDVVIDDGSHKGQDVASALFTLFRRLSPGGLYFIEDIQTSYWPPYNGSSIASDCYDTAVRWLKLSVDLINRDEVLDPTVFPLMADLDMSELHVFHNLAVLRSRPAGEPAKSKILTDEQRRQFFEADVAMHGDIAELHAELAADPAKYRTLLRAVTSYGGLAKFLGDQSVT
jgi:hypothetical protein